MSEQAPRASPARITEYPARTLKPLTAYGLAKDLTRVIPGGALVTITTNTNHEGDTAHTATVHMGGEYYGCNVTPEQFTKIEE